MLDFPKMKPKTQETASRMSIDPVCGMEVDPKTARHTYKHRGETYSFCAEGCKTAFEKDPGAYLDRDPGGVCRLGACNRRQGWDRRREPWGSVN